MRLVLGVTTFGCGESGYSDGPHSEAKFDAPAGLCLSLDGESLLCADQNNHRIRRIDLNDGLVSTFIGSGVRDLKNGARLQTGLYRPYSVSAHPLKANCYFVADHTSIRYCDGEAVSLIAGGQKWGYADGVGGDAMLWFENSLLCTSDGQTLYFSDTLNHRLRCVDLKTQAVCGNGQNECQNGVGLNASFDDPSHTRANGQFN